MAPRRLSTTRRLRPRSRHPPLCSQRRHRPPTVVARPRSRPPMSSLPLDRFHAFVDGLVDGASRFCPPREIDLDSSILLLEGRRLSIPTAHLTLHATTPAHNRYSRYCDPVCTPSHSCRSYLDYSRLPLRPPRRLRLCGRLCAAPPLLATCGGSGGQPSVQPLSSPHISPYLPISREG